MKSGLSSKSSPTRAIADVPAIVGVVVAIAFFVVSGAVVATNIRTMRDHNREIMHSHEVIKGLGDLQSSMLDAETGQRGFLLTGDQSYLGPYIAAMTDIEQSLDTLGVLTAGDEVQRANLEPLRRHVAAKLEELRETIDLYRAGGISAALPLVTTDRGKAEMDAIRGLLDSMRQEMTRQREQRVLELADAYRRAWVSGVMSALLGIGLALVIGYLTRRAAIARARQDWLQQGQVGLAGVLQGDKSTTQLGDGVLSFLADYAGAQAGALFAGERGYFQRSATLGVAAGGKVADSFTLGDGLLGRVARDGKPVLIENVPDGYLTIGSALGEDRPRHLVIAPLVADEVVNGVIELGFLQAVDPATLDLLHEGGGAIGVALRSANFRTELKDLLEETQRQSEELQVQSEELRVSNEELEEHGRALRESQVRLEQQQVELEQTNVQLEEQAQRLEAQAEGLGRAKAATELKARELEQASRYKTDFLANMSHELRTPLNSLLILSKLLGDNADANLTDEQVRFARTIQASGNDLLTLINDILDLSKIEAGHLQVQADPLPLHVLAADLERMFRPVADDRRIGFTIEIAPDCPASITSDRQRLEQVLKNLLSNAFKFTEAGSVTLAVRPAEGERVAFAVTDTGIGISEDQQESIFNAFHQADGAISRKYGGTGLGLSISRELARLLGGAITLDSTPGEGSTFTVTLPVTYDPAGVAPRDARQAPPPVAMPRSVPRMSATAPSQVRAPVRVEDDRDNLTGSRRVLLIIEDDGTFAEIVRDLSREMDFQCLVAGTAEEALRLARQYKPNAIVMDVGLPDHSGLTVLDQLKRDDATRHIPVHVVSAADHSQTALSLGAVGYRVKPVPREELAEVLQTLASKLTHSLRRVLIVEDDPVQRDAVGALLASRDVETVGVGTAAECLERLRHETFDCMVLDLSLPDASGYSLLETLSGDGGQAFPPVIVYTGHDLSPDDEQRLRRYSNSIIIKGAKSPERLLEEVSLFLHQVVSDLPPEQQKMIRSARNRDAVLEGRRILIVEDDIRNVYSLSNVLEPRGAKVEIARNGQEAIAALDASARDPDKAIDLVLMDVMMPVMDGLTATREIRGDPRWASLPVIALTAKAMPDDQARCISAGANDYMAKPLDVDKLLSLVRVWMPR